MPIQIVAATLDITREPLRHPFRLKGGCFTEKWLCHASLTGASGITATGIGGLSVLWSDRAVFLEHTEVGGNMIMALMLEHALQLARGRSFETPVDLTESLVAPTDQYGREITGHADLRKTFALNALVALDNAAWILYARESGATDLDALIPDQYRAPLSRRNAQIAMAPMIGYGETIAQVQQLAADGYCIFKLKLGSPGEPEVMLAADAERMTQLHAVLGKIKTPHTDDGKIRYYLDANSRYPDPGLMQRFLAHARAIGMFGQIIILEEPFAEETAFDVHDLGVRVAADESLHDVADLARKAELGYGAIALKAAGKTLSMTLKMAAEARRCGIPCLAADSGCAPVLVQWNKNIAARLEPFPGMKMNLMETNGAQHYAHWDELMAAHPCADAQWLQARNGVFELDDDFYARSGGIFT